MQPPTPLRMLQVEGLAQYDGKIVVLLEEVEHQSDVNIYMKRFPKKVVTVHFGGFSVG